MLFFYPPTSCPWKLKNSSEFPTAALALFSLFPRPQVPRSFPVTPHRPFLPITQEPKRVLWDPLVEEGMDDSDEGRLLSLRSLATTGEVIVLLGKG